MKNDSVRVEDERSTVPNQSLWGALRVMSAEGSRLELVGWALGKGAEVSQIEVMADDQVVASARLTLARPDVAAQFPDRESAANCGFQVAMEAQGEGKSTLYVWATLSDGCRSPLGEIQVHAPDLSS